MRMRIIVAGRVIVHVRMAGFELYTSRNAKHCGASLSDERVTI